MRAVKIALVAMMCGFVPMVAQAASVISTRIERGQQMERVYFELDNRLTHKKLFTLNNPPRVVLDVPALQSAHGVSLPPHYGGRLIHNIRHGKFSQDTSRIVLDLNQDAEVQNIYLYTPKAGENWALVIDIMPKGGAASPATQAPKPLVQNPAVAPVAPTVEVTPMPAVEAQRVLKESGFTRIPVPVLKPQGTARDANKPIIVIDAGHGGKDTGAIGASGYYEKKITLAYADALKEALLRTGQFRVVMTRDNDRFILLKDRVNIARQAQGDVFISLHADSNPNHETRGVSVYTVSEQASDAETAALAKRENKADLAMGINFGQEDEQVANILLDLTMRDTKQKSSLLADAILSTMHPKIYQLSNTHRFAGFRVLKAPDIPSVLIELGFLSNSQDEKLLQSREYRGRVAESIVKGIERFLAEKG